MPFLPALTGNAERWIVTNDLEILKRDATGEIPEVGYVDQPGHQPRWYERYADNGWRRISPPAKP